MEYLYDAFISYRHLPVDMEIAEKLQTLLENHKKKDGKKLTVFRDKSDLPTSGDLGSDIRTALAQSRFLILVCSPEYQQSKWCMEELRYFRELHGNANTHILPILVEGEPADSFPALLRYEDRQVTDAYGTPSVVQVAVEPLGADVRAESSAERKRLLRKEYLRLAAPMLGVTYDQLYQRAQRKKRAVIAGVIAALAAFAVYSVIMITQITQRQKQLEAKQAELIAKQQELYEDQSVRLANEALELAADNAPMAMLLTDVALPADLENPDYPLTPEAEVSVRSVALQHQLEDATEFFTLKASITFDNTGWEVGKFYEDGKYFTVYDYSRTWLYEAHTGMLITELPDVGYYFFDGIERYGIETTTTEEDGTVWTGYALYHTRTGEELGRYEKIASDATYSSFYPIYDKESDQLWIADYLIDPDNEDSHLFIAYGWFDTEGSYHEEDTLPEHLQDTQLIEDSYYYQNDYIYSDGQLTAEYNYYYGWPDAYQKAVDAFNKQYNYSMGRGTSDTNNVSAITKSQDGSFYMMYYYFWDNKARERSGITFWAVEENCLLWQDEYWSFQEVNTQLIYRLLDNELQILEANPENFTVPQTPPIFEYVSQDGKYGFGEYDTGDYDGYSQLVYDTAKLQDVFYEEEEGIEYISELGDYQCITYPIHYDITPNGDRMVGEENSRVVIYDVTSGDMITWADISEKNVRAVAINDDGTLIAYVNVLDDGFEIKLIDPDARKYVGSVTHRDANSDANYTLPYLEISGNQLLLETSQQAFVYNLEDLEQEPWIIDLSDTYMGAGQSPRQSVFTEDGLLILPASDGTAYGNQMRVKAIIDLQTRERVDFYTTDIWHGEYYYYDDQGGNLIQSFTNDVVVQRRGENGDFEVAYTITPQHANMQLITAGHATDGTWLVLQNEEYCEIYRLEDGQLCYMIRKPDDRNSQMAVIDGRLYDFCVGWDRSIPLLSTEEAREYVRDALVYEGTARTLTDQEMQDYYIPSNWREK